MDTRSLLSVVWFGIAEAVNVSIIVIIIIIIITIIAIISSR